MDLEVLCVIKTTWMLVLLVDRSAGIIERMTEVFTEVKNISAIYSASSYNEAQKLLKENKYDIVILDNDLLRNESLEIIEDIKITHEKCCVIVLFTQIDIYIWHHYRFLGVDFLFDKYYELEKVTELLTAYQT